jgi:hypothetical protein
MITRLLAYWGVALIGATAQTPAFAQDALVEEADAGSGVDRFDYLDAGQKIELGDGRRLVVSYLRSCWRETIKGGTVLIGRDSSSLVGGTLERERVKCSGTALRLAPDEGQQSAVMVFRAPAKLAQLATRSLSRDIYVRNVLFGTSALFELPGGGRVSIERLDVDSAPFEIEVPRGINAARSRYDMAEAGHLLAPGGLYRARWGTQSLLFAVHESAQPGPAAGLGRLLRLPPS